ncbi:MAG: trypsin-like peptidase domain-containing protein [Ignavibacteriales bacterium]|nr:trypsin-like peptidase domain-containing protein [Ignavibacteriales bacterium]
MTKKIFFTIYFVFSTLAFPQKDLTPEQIFEKVKDAVVLILSYDSYGELVSQGSGVIISKSGYILTNYHILSVMSRIKIIHANEVVENVEIVRTDINKDLLVLKMPSTPVSVITMAKSNDLKIGQRIYAIGSPMGFENTISEGIISGFRNYGEGINLIQITASISQGSSGGAVVNSRGELIGISAYTVAEGQNINFAIPIEEGMDLETKQFKKSSSENNDVTEIKSSLWVTLISGILVIGFILGVVLFVSLKKPNFPNLKTRNKIKFRLIDLASDYVLNSNSTHLRIGRATDNNLILRSLTISKHHAEINYDERLRSYSIKNYSKVNPIKVNKIKISTKTLTNGDIIQIAQYKFRFVVE